LITSRCADKAFISPGFSNLKDAKVAFRNYEQTKCHKEAVQTVVALSRDYEDCAELLSPQHAKLEVNNRQMMLKLLSNIHVKVYYCKVKVKKMTPTTTSYLELEG